MLPFACTYVHKESNVQHGEFGSRKSILSGAEGIQTHLLPPAPEPQRLSSKNPNRSLNMGVFFLL